MCVCGGGKRQRLAETVIVPQWKQRVRRLTLPVNHLQQALLLPFRLELLGLYPIAPRILLRNNGSQILSACTLEKRKDDTVLA